MIEGDTVQKLPVTAVTRACLRRRISSILHYDNRRYSASDVLKSLFDGINKFNPKFSSAFCSGVIFTVSSITKKQKSMYVCLVGTRQGADDTGRTGVGSC